MHLTMFSRRGCHLCQDMLFQLEQIYKGRGLVVDEVFIDGDPALEQQYGRKVPVLMTDGKEICHYFLDPQALDSIFNKMN